MEATDYCNYFGFVESPFGVAADPRFFYRNESYDDVLTLLQHAIESRKGIVVCTGEVGTGKTLLLKILMRHLESNGRAILIANASPSIDEVLRLILRRWGVAKLAKGRAAMVEQLTEVLAGLGETKPTAALLVDEAQDLSEKTLDDLRLLSNLEAEGEQLLQMVLMGQPELETKLDQPELEPLKQRVALRRRLVPIAPREVGRYIDYRVQTAGYHGKTLFDRNAVEKIALSSGGVPRLINTVCDNALRKAYATGNERVTPAIIEAILRPQRIVEPSRSKIEAQASGALKKEFQEEVPWEIFHSTKTENPPLNGGLWQSNMVQLVEPEDLARPEQTSDSRTGPFNHKNVDWLRLASIASFVVAVLGGVLWYAQSGPDLSQLAIRFKNFAAHWSLNWRKIEATQQLSKEIPSGVSSFSSERLTPELADPALKSEPGNGNRPPNANDAAAQNPGEIAASAVQNPPTTLATIGQSNDQPKPRASESKAPSRNSNSEPVEKHESKKERASLGTFEVVGPSYVRDRPTSDAEIVATLQPGTRVQVVAQTSEYFQVRSVEDREIRGYVHREDAFFGRRR